MQEDATTETVEAAAPAAAPAEKAKSARARKAAKAAKKTTAKKAPAAKKVSAPRKGVGEPRRSRGLLENDVLSVVQDFVKGKVKLADGKKLTPHVISTTMAEADSLDSKPSAGAISNILVKWGDIGFAKINPKPLAFTAFTKAGGEKGENLTALKEKAAAKKKAGK